MLKALADGGYTGQNFADEIKKFSGTEVKWLNAMNSIIFRLFLSAGLWNAPLGWLDKCRRFWRNCELLQNSFQMFSLAFIRIILRRY